MTLLQTVKNAVISVINKIYGKNNPSYSPEYVRSQNQPKDKLIQALRQSRKPL